MDQARPKEFLIAMILDLPWALGAMGHAAEQGERLAGLGLEDRTSGCCDVVAHRVRQRIAALSSAGRWRDAAPRPAVAQLHGAQ